MKLLLDTHAFLWLIAGDASLSRKARDSIEAVDNEPLLSAASLWEKAIKVSLGKLTLNFKEPFSEAIGGQLRENGITVLPLALTHIGQVAVMPFHHRAPFDGKLGSWHHHRAPRVDPRPDRRSVLAPRFGERLAPAAPYVHRPLPEAVFSTVPAN